jgi:hypothetical protein
MRSSWRLVMALVLLLLATGAVEARNDGNCGIIGPRYCGTLCLDYYGEGQCLNIDDPTSVCVYLGGGCASIRDSPCCSGGSLF